MTDERRYKDEEVAEIFEIAAATGTPRRGADRAEGVTLSELMAIGEEVGIPPARIAEAAQSLARQPEPQRTDFGMVVTAGRVVDLPRALTDREWGMLVGELRSTFRARGHEESHGDRRQWTNSNLHAYVEPTATGYRLRMGTLKGNAVALNRMGAGGFLVGLVSFGAVLLAGEPSVAAFLLSAAGAGLIGINALRLPRWVRERQAQMDYIAAHAHALVAMDRDSPSVT